MSESDGNTAMLAVKMGSFLPGFSCPTPTLLLLAPILLGIGEATHSELLGTKRDNCTVISSEDSTTHAVHQQNWF